MSILLQLGVVNVTNGLLMCSVVSAIGVVLYLRASTESPMAVADAAHVPVAPATVSPERARHAHAA